ncbi:MAG: hypothetical protein ACMUEM_04390 [Flavobacteriales bacterium AspAUS03]
MNQILEYLVKEKIIIIVLLDFIGADYEKSFRMAVKKHALTGIHVFDEKEILPDIGMLYVQDQESSELVLADSSSKLIRQSYETFYQDVQECFF